MAVQIKRTRNDEYRYSFDEATRTHLLTTNYREYSKVGYMGFFIPYESYKEGDTIKIDGKIYTPYTNDGTILPDNFFTGEGIPTTTENEDKNIIEIITDPEAANCYLNKLVLDRLNVIQFDDITSTVEYSITDEDYVKIFDFDYVQAVSFCPPAAMAKIEVTVDNRDELEAFMTFKLTLDDVDLHIYPQASFRSNELIYTIPFFAPLTTDSTGLHHFELLAKQNTDTPFTLYRKNVRCSLRGINVYPVSP